MRVDSSNVNLFAKKQNTHNVFMLFYMKGDSNTHGLLYDYFTTAMAFSPVKSVLFARIDCSASRELCSYFGVQMIPEMRLLPKDKTMKNVKPLDVRAGEQIDSYLNHYLGRAVIRDSPLGTFISGKGGLNNKYGRDSELDELAHAFMEQVGDAHRIDRRTRRRTTST